MKNKKKILLTGASGFIGQNLMKLNKNYFIYGVVRKKNKKLFKSENIKYLEINLTEKSFVNKLPKDIDYILHFAQSKSYKKDILAANDILDVNFISTLRLVNFAKQIKIDKFIYASSGSVYDSSHNLLLKESQNILSKNVYSLSKYYSELLIKRYNSFFKTLSLRIFFPYEINESSGHGYLNFLLKIMTNNDDPIMLSQNIYFRPIEIKDLCKSVYKFLKINNKEPIINLSGKKLYNSHDLLIDIKKYFKLDKENIKPKINIYFNNSTRLMFKYLKKTNHLNNNINYKNDIKLFINNSMKKSFY